MTTINPDDIDQEEPTYRAPVTMGVITVGLIIVIIGLIAGPIKVGEEKIHYSLLILMSLFAYLVFSFRFWEPVKEDERGVLILLGKPVLELDSGPTFAPLGFYSIRRINRKVQQREFPAEPDMIFRGDLKTRELLPKGMKPPIRVPFTESIEEADVEKVLGPLSRVLTPEGFAKQKVGKPLTDDDYIKFQCGVPEDGLAKRVTAEPSAVVRIRIDEPIDFIRNIGNEIEMFRQIEDEIVSVITNIYARMSVAQALINLRWMGYILWHAVERRTGARGGENIRGNQEVKSWGVSIQAVNVKLIELSHDLNTAIDDAAAAPFAKAQVKIRAEGEKDKRILEGEGAARAAHDLEQGTLEGRGKGLRDLADRIEVDGSEALAAEVAREVASEGNTVIVGTDGVRQLAGLAAAFVNKPKSAESKDDAGEAEEEDKS